MDTQKLPTPEITPPQPESTPPTEPTPPPPVEPASPPQETVPPPPPPRSSKLPLFIGALGVITLLFSGGYWYLTMATPSEQVQPLPQKIAQNTLPSPSATPASEEEQLEAILSLPDDSDLKDIELALQGL